MTRCSGACSSSAAARRRRPARGPNRRPLAPEPSSRSSVSCSTSTMPSTPCRAPPCGGPAVCPTMTCPPSRTPPTPWRHLRRRLRRHWLRQAQPSPSAPPLPRLLLRLGFLHRRASPSSVPRQSLLRLRVPAPLPLTGTFYSPQQMGTRSPLPRVARAPRPLPAPGRGTYPFPRAWSPCGAPAMWEALVSCGWATLTAAGGWCGLVPTHDAPSSARRLRQ